MHIAHIADTKKERSISQARERRSPIPEVKFRVSLLLLVTEAGKPRITQQQNIRDLRRLVCALVVMMPKATHDVIVAFDFSRRVEREYII